MHRREKRGTGRRIRGEGFGEEKKGDSLRSITYWSPGGEILRIFFRRKHRGEGEKERRTEKGIRHFSGL